MVNGVSSSSFTGVQFFQKPDESKMFSDLSNKVGADSTGITKDDLESYLETLQSDDSSDSKEIEMISNMIKDFDTLSGGSDTITADSFKTGMESLKPKGKPEGPGGDMFSDLSDKVGADDSGITKDDLESYLEELKSTGSASDQEIEMISDLIENFDEVSDGTDVISADSLSTYVENKMKNDSSNASIQTVVDLEPQDPSTVTSEQLQSPIDIRI